MPDDYTQETPTSGKETRQREAPAGGPLPMVDVIVPAYGGLGEVRACLRSVLIHPQSTPFELVVVNDASPEPEIAAYLEELAAGGSITLLSNKNSIGFVDSANLGMMLHPDRDVVILNSDTEVSGDWLDRLRRAAVSAPDIATVTPFSNNSALTGYPCHMHDNPLPPDTDAADLDALFQEMNPSRYVEIPAAVGFCTYITRSSLDRVGYLDSLHYQGYGEVKDFSLRARGEGFRHLLAGDSFVLNRAGTSFDMQAVSRSEAEEATLRRFHPAYDPLIRQHCDLDPARPLRRRVDIARLSRWPGGRLLFISHGLGGGIDEHIGILATRLRPEWEVLLLRPSGPSEASLEWAPDSEEFAAFFAIPDGYGELLGFLKSLGISRVHIHHTMGVDPRLLDLPGDLDVPYDFTVHDYYSICPFANLVDASGDYCGEPPPTGCDSCFAMRHHVGESDPRTRRQASVELLDRAERVIVPSQDTLDRMKRYFPEAPFLLLPHPEEDTGPVPVDAHGSGKVKVLILGDLAPHEGLRLLEACAADAHSRGLPLYFRVLGRPLGRVRQEPDLPLSFSGACSVDRLPESIECERPDLIFFTSRWPAPWSSTLGAAMRTGLPVAAPRLGSFPERLEGRAQSHLMEWDTAAPDWNDLFISLARKTTRSGHGS